MFLLWVLVFLAGPQDNRPGLCKRSGSREPLHIICGHSAVSGESFIVSVSRLEMCLKPGSDLKRVTYFKIWCTDKD